MHDIAVRCGNGTRAAGFGVPKVDHGEDHSVGFGDGSNLSTRAGAVRVMGFPLGRYLYSSWHRQGELGVFPRGWYLQSAAE